ncbi:PREDICTED: folliculin-like isoform X2 [Priapulus caudatus]|uniref:Folliculin n=1 Tax=Priapulus caudatus TaxID=37621 RepID=A0ABM1EFS4_PRICU|nr:PREDICTED: folliculin-like isoform X2 [Priapulus caudatus]
MNAVIALCHFCELHGPSIVFSTQAFHSQVPAHLLEPSPSQTESQDGSNGSGQEQSSQFSFYGSLEHWLRPPRTPQTSTPPTPQSPITSGAAGRTTEMCEACRSMAAGQPGFVSNDHEAKVSYVSSQYPCHPEIFSIVRQACVRSLSCEVCPGREGPIFFGDDVRGHVLSHTFFVKDSHARGFQRWYSIIVVMTDKVFLLNSWPFLVTHLRIIIDKIQMMALKVYEAEQTECPQRSLRLSSSVNPRDFLRHRGMNKPARSLVELTHEKNLFARLHMWFTWLLKAGGNRMTEKLFEGPPTEDTVIDMERLEETEEGFIKLFTTTLEVSKKTGADDQSDKEEKSQLATTREAEDDESSCPEFKNIRHLLRVIVRGSQRWLVKSVIQALQVFLPKGCSRVIAWSSTYVDSWMCNFLGLELGVEIPEHVSEADKYSVLDILAPKDAQSLSSDTSDQFDGYTFTVSSKTVLPDVYPALLVKMEQAMVQAKFTNEVLECSLTAMKEQWMNKVKVLFKFSRASGSHSQEEVQKLLRVLGAGPHDEPLLKFWMTGLSIQYKTHALESSFTASNDSYYEVCDVSTGQ